MQRVAKATLFVFANTSPAVILYGADGVIDRAGHRCTPLMHTINTPSMHAIKTGKRHAPPFPITTSLSSRR
ncbi:MAG: hypothetical protein ACRDDA_07750 [Aeromonas sp.]